MDDGTPEVLACRCRVLPYLRTDQVVGVVVSAEEEEEEETRMQAVVMVRLG